MIFTVYTLATVVMVCLYQTTAQSVPPECSKYRWLNESSRAAVRTAVTTMCDNTLIPGWSRIGGLAGNAMPTSCVPTFHCGTNVPGWLQGGHPPIKYQSVYRTACFNWENNCCRWHAKVTVRNCGDFYVYALPRLSMCQFRYCGNGTTNEDLNESKAVNILLIVGISIGAAFAVSVLCIGLSICVYCTYEKKKRERPNIVSSTRTTSSTGATARVPASSPQQHPPGALCQQTAITNPAFNSDLEHSEQEGKTLVPPPGYTPFPSESNPSPQEQHKPPPVYMQGGDLAAGEGVETTTETLTQPVAMPPTSAGSVA